MNFTKLFKLVNVEVFGSSSGTTADWVQPLKIVSIIFQLYDLAVSVFIAIILQYVEFRLNAECIIKDSCKANTKNESIFVLGAGLVVNPYKIQSFYWFATFHLILSGKNLGVICSLQIPDPLSLVDFSSSPPINIKLNFPISYRVH